MAPPAGGPRRVVSENEYSQLHIKTTARNTCSKPVLPIACRVRVRGTVAPPARSPRRVAEGMVRLGVRVRRVRVSIWYIYTAVVTQCSQSRVGLGQG